MSDLATNHNLELFLTRDQIDQRVQQLGEEISRDFTGQPLLMVGVLKGAAIFLADLARAVELECTFEFISVSSYGSDMRTSGEARVARKFDQSIEGRNVLLVEDILDTGITICHLQNLMLSQRPSRLKIVALLDKPSRRVQNIHADYVGFTIPNRFIVGYGMDCAEHYRNLPDIYFVPSVIQE